MTFMRDRSASEEFTSLPSLAVVITGITIFLATVYNLYAIHEEKTKNMEYFEVSHFIMEKIISSRSPLTTSFLLIDINNVENTTTNKLREYCNPVPYTYNITIYCDGHKIKSWGPPPRGLAISRHVAIKEENGVKIGKIVLWVWKEYE